MSGHTYTHTHIHTYTHDNYYNPRCAHAHRGLIMTDGPIGTLLDMSVHHVTDERVAADRLQASFWTISHHHQSIPLSSLSCAMEHIALAVV